MKYYIDFGTGPGQYADTYEDAQKIADDNALCLQHDIIIYEDHQEYARRPWYSMPYDPEESEDFRWIQRHHGHAAGDA